VRFPVPFDHQPIDLRVQQGAEPASLRVGVEGDAVEVHEVVVPLGEPPVVDRVVGAVRRHHQAEADDALTEFDRQCDRTLAEEVGHPLDVDRADLGHVGVIDLDDPVEIAGLDRTDYRLVRDVGLGRHVRHGNRIGRPSPPAIRCHRVIGDQCPRPTQGVR
jgi:hypothetical protein